MKTEIIALVHKFTYTFPGENSGPLSQINDPPGQELNIQAVYRFRQADHSFRSNLRTRVAEFCFWAD